MNKKKPRVKRGADGKARRANLPSIESLLEIQSGLLKAQTASELSKDALARFGSIPLLFERQTDPPGTVGVVAYDSWTQGPALALRDVTNGHVRRLRVPAGPSGRSRAVDAGRQRRDRQLRNRTLGGENRHRRRRGQGRPRSQYVGDARRARLRAARPGDRHRHADPARRLRQCGRRLDACELRHLVEG